MIKLKKYQFVKVSNILPELMSHFEKGYVGIVRDISDNDYSIYQIENGKIINSISWYPRKYLKLLKVQSRDLALDMIEEYEKNRGIIKEYIQTRSNYV